MSTLALKQHYHGRNIYIFKESFMDHSKQWWTGYIQLKETDPIYSLVKENRDNFDDFYELNEYVDAFLPITAAGKEEKLMILTYLLGLIRQNHFWQILH